MKLFNQGLLQRAVTAVIFVAIMLGGLYISSYSFIALFALITALCLWEFYGMVLEHQDSRAFAARKFIGLGLGLTPFVVVSLLQLGMLTSTRELIIAIAIFSSPFIFLLFIYELYAKAQRPFTNIAFLYLGVLYIGLPMALLTIVAFEGQVFYANTIFGLLLLSWLNDTGAYLVGSMIGKTKLFPRISPNKTWEGSLGGVVLTLVVSYILSVFFDELRTLDWLVLGLIVSVFGSIGDLVESMLKRSVGVKDSGNILPGHGGILDRFDAFIFLVPFASAYLLWVRM